MLSRRRLIVAAAAVLACACGRPVSEPVPVDPAEAAVRELFALAAETDPSAERIETLFGAFEGETPAHLYDSLSALSSAGPARLLRREELPGLDRLVIDLEAELGTDGTGAYSVQLEPAGDTWRVVWFQGPGVAWPPHSRRGDGLTSSPDG